MTAIGEEEDDTHNLDYLDVKNIDLDDTLNDKPSSKRYGAQRN